jgi:hypothetical protein
MTAVTGGGGLLDFESNFVPQKNSYVWIMFEDEENLKRPFYLFNASLPGSAEKYKNYYDNIDSTLRNLKTAKTKTSTYPNVVSWHFGAKTVMAFDTSSSNSTFVVQNGKGSYFIIDPDGNIGLYSTKDLDFETSTGVKIYSDSVNFTIEDGTGNKQEFVPTGIKISDINQNTIETLPGGMYIGNSASSLFEILLLIATSWNTGVAIDGLGLPVTFLSNPNLIQDTVKIPMVFLPAGS